MKTKAKVVLIQDDSGMVGVQTVTGDITVFELLGCEKVRLGVVLIGYWYELDNQVVHNESRDQKLEVFIHECGCEREEVNARYFKVRTNASTNSTATLT